MRSSQRNSAPPGALCSGSGPKLAVAGCRERAFFFNLKNDEQNINTKLQRAQINQFIKKKKKLGSQLKMDKRRTHKIYMQIAF